MFHTDRLAYLSHDYCASLGIATRDVVESIERLLRRAAEGQAWNAPKTTIITGDGRYMMATLCASNTPPYMAVKSLMVSPDNAERGLESINAAVILHDSVTGVPVGVIDGNWVTAVRTAGLSCVAAKYLARKNASVAAFIGCGIQARSHLDAFFEMFPLTEVRAVGRGAASRDGFCRHAEEIGLRAIGSEGVQTALDGADLVVTSLPLSYDGAPFIDANWLKPGCFCAITDLAIPWIPDSMLAFDRIVIDDLEQERRMDRSLVSSALIKGDISGLVLGQIAPRSSDAERCAFVFRGLALGDLALAILAWQRHTQGESSAT